MMGHVGGVATSPSEVRGTGPRVRLRAFVSDTRGSVTAEFAITIPAVLLVLGLVIGGVVLAAERVALTALVGDIARLEARGDIALAADRLGSFTGNPRIQRTGDSRILCVTARAGPRAGLLAAVAVSARGCAARSISADWEANGAESVASGVRGLP